MGRMRNSQGASLVPSECNISDILYLPLPLSVHRVKTSTKLQHKIVARI